jgi:hypothetical protein
VVNAKQDWTDVLVNKLRESRYYMIQSSDFNDQIGFIFVNDLIGMTGYLEFLKDIPEQGMIHVMLHYLHYPVKSGGFALEKMDQPMNMSYEALNLVTKMGQIYTMQYRTEE